MSYSIEVLTIQYTEFPGISCIHNVKKCCLTQFFR